MYGIIRTSLSSGMLIAQSEVYMTVNVICWDKLFYSIAAFTYVYIVNRGELIVTVNSWGRFCFSEYYKILICMVRNFDYW